MNLHNFIFTEKPVSRYYRHIVFWLVRCLFLLLSAEMTAYLILDSPKISFMANLSRALVSICWEMIFTYGMAYYILPRFLLQRKYLAFAMALLGFAGITLAGTIGIDRYFQVWGERPAFSFLSMWGMIWGYTGYGPVAVCGLFLTIKILKIHYKKTEEKEILIRENEDSELQLLKAQIHPHFLFNTLNNIYSFALDRSPYAAELAENLSGTMRYMITDCEADLVPLEKELKMIRDYIKLEKVRYGDRLRMELQIDGNGDHKMVAPFLMIPFIENCFKHGASQLLGLSWIKMHISIGETALRLELSNNKPSFIPSPADDRRIGLKNVRKRLELLYPKNYSLQISQPADTFQVSMRVPLHPLSTESLLHAEY